MFGFELPMSAAASFDRILFRPLLVVSTKRLDVAALAPLAPTLATVLLTAAVAAFAAASLYSVLLSPLPSLVAACVRKSRALRELEIPFARPTSLLQVAFGAVACLIEGDAGFESNFYRDILMKKWWLCDAKKAPLLASRSVLGHFIFVHDPAAAMAVLSRGGGRGGGGSGSQQQRQLDKWARHQHGFNLMSCARESHSVMTLSSFSAEWRLLRRALMPAFSNAALRQRFEPDIRPAGEAGVEAVVSAWRAAAAVAAAESAAAAADAASSRPLSPPRRGGGGGRGGGAVAVSIDVEALSAAMAIDVITAFNFGLRSNSVERWGATEAAKIISDAAAAAEAGANHSRHHRLVLPPPPAVPPHLIRGAEGTAEALHAAFDVAQNFISQPFQSNPALSWTPAHRKWKREVQPFRKCIASVVEAAITAADDDGDDDGGDKGAEREGEERHETVFSRLRSAAPVAAAAAAAAAAATSDAAAAAAASDAAASSAVLLRESSILYSAGIDTMSRTLAFTLSLLASHPEAMRRVEEELASRGLLEEEEEDKTALPRKVEFSDLSRSSLPYLHACLMESMRLLPVVAGGTTRKVGPGGFEVTVPEWREGVTGDDNGDDGNDGGGDGNNGKKRKMRTVVLPEGCLLWVPFFVLHRAEEFWGPDAAEFKPERFLDLGPDGNSVVVVGGGAAEGGEGEGRGEAGGASASASTTSAASASAARRFFPFSFGARDCAGQLLARASMVSILATLLGRVSLSLDRSKMGGSLLPEDGSNGGGGVGDAVFEREGMSFTMTVRGGMWLLATPRAKLQHYASGEAFGFSGAAAVEE